jgi:hypothetical protein
MDRTNTCCQGMTRKTRRRRAHNAGMPKFVPYRIRIAPDPDRPTRFRWSLSDEYAGLFKSSANFASEREAIADGERFVDKRILIWQKRT